MELLLLFSDRCSLLVLLLMILVAEVEPLVLCHRVLSLLNCIRLSVLFVLVGEVWKQSMTRLSGFK